MCKSNAHKLLQNSSIVFVNYRQNYTDILQWYFAKKFFHNHHIHPFWTKPFNSNILKAHWATGLQNVLWFLWHSQVKICTYQRELCCQQQDLWKACTVLSLNLFEALVWHKNDSTGCKKQYCHLRKLQMQLQWKPVKTFSKVTSILILLTLSLFDHTHRSKE